MAYSIIDPEYLKPANLLLIILILVTGGVGLISLFIYLAERRKIPILVFDSLWYQDLGSDREYYVKVKREKGEGRAQGVQGFVGVKNKLDQNLSRWLLYPNESEAEITQYAYLFLFLTSNNNGNVEIVFPGTERSRSPKNYLYSDYKDDKLSVEIEAIRGRVKKKLFVKKMDDIVHDAKEIIF